MNRQTLSGTEFSIDDKSFEGTAALIWKDLFAESINVGDYVILLPR